MTHRIAIRGTDHVITVGAGQTILDAALDAAVPYPHGCRSGRCGACKSRLVRGDVELLQHTPFALSAKEREQGFILACRAVPQQDGEVIWLAEEDDAIVPTPQRYRGRVVGISDATHDIKRVSLRLENDELFPFAAGQYARLTFPGAPSRDYSMANLPGQSELEFHIRHVPRGLTSGRVASSVRIGDAVLVEGPFGASYLRERHAGPILCVAGGSGLAPIKSIVGSALAAGLRQPIHVYFGVRAERDLYLIDHFAALGTTHPNVSFTPVLSEPGQATGRRTGWVSDAVAADLTDLDGWKAYVAGPPAMVEATGRVLAERRLRAQDLYADVFFTPELTAAAS